MNRPCPEADTTTGLHKTKAPLQQQRLDVVTIGARERRVISVSARVRKVGEHFVWAETDSQSACAHCSGRLGCGVSGLTQLFGRRAKHIRIPNSMNASLGDEITLGIDETALLKQTFMLYLLPLLSMLICAGVTEGIFNNQELTVLAAGCGLFAGLAIVRYFALRNAKDSVLKPFMLTCKRADEKVLLKKPDEER